MSPEISVASIFYVNQRGRTSFVSQLPSSIMFSDCMKQSSGFTDRFSIFLHFKVRLIDCPFLLSEQVQK
jgi:hypothetical protein